MLTVWLNLEEVGMNQCDDDVTMPFHGTHQCPENSKVRKKIMSIILVADKSQESLFPKVKKNAPAMVVLENLTYFKNTHTATQHAPTRI